MQVLSTATGASWTELDHASVDPAIKAATEKALLAINRELLDSLNMANLLVLTGLGTSLCVQDKAGARAAPTMKDLWDETKSLAGTTFDQVLSESRYDLALAGENIEYLLSQCQIAQQFSPSAFLQTFIEQTEKLIGQKCNFVTPATNLDTHEAFLRRVARRSTRHPRLKLFSTNYDLCFETSASRSRFVLVDGFSHTLPQEFEGAYFYYDLVRRADNGSAPDFIPNVFHLYKLHGSVDWERSGVVGVRKVPGTPKPLLIYPRHSKYESSYEPPFVDLMGQFQFALRQPNTALLVLGFGFNDRHLVQPLMSAVRSNVGLRLTVVSPALATKGNEHVDRLAELVQKGDTRIQLLSGSFEQFVPMIPDLVSKSDLERHEARVRGA